VVTGKPSSFRLAIFFGVFLLVVDFLSKYFIVQCLPYGSGKEIILFRNFLGIEASITHAINTGAAWGLFSEMPMMLLFVRLLLIVALIVFLFFRSSARFRVPVVLIICGAFGNVLDFFLYGHVVDMIHCIFWGYDYPVFNVADATIAGSTLAIVVMTLKE
jgi:signal peptidase II